MDKLIGMLDSPYVRRTAISLHCLGIPFEHHSISVFRTFKEFQQFNPVVKAPSLVLDSGEVLMDSTLIIQYGESRAGGRSLMPRDPAGLRHALQLIGLALAACEKSVQIVYERNLRPAEKQHGPWLDRIRTQVLAACSELEARLKQSGRQATEDGLSQADITSAVVWQFIEAMVPDIVPANGFPTLAAFSEQAEKLPQFLAFPPDGPGVAPVTEQAGRD